MLPLLLLIAPIARYEIGTRLLQARAAELVCEAIGQPAASLGLMAPHRKGHTALIVSPPDAIRTMRSANR